MINKRSLWFLTLFSLILVLSIYYITMPSELLIETNNKAEKVSKTEINKENAELVALRVEEEEKILDKITELKKILSDTKANTEEKNKALEELQKINKNKAEEEKLEEKIETEFKFKSYININENNINVTVDSKNQDKKTANQIMRSIQSEYDMPMTISVKFQK